jgi:hypothetical protein
MGRVDVGCRAEQNQLVSVNRAVGPPVERGVLIRNGVVAILAVLALAAPAWAGGERFSAATPSLVMPFRSAAPRFPSTVLPASSPFVVATQPFVVTAPGGVRPTAPSPFVSSVPGFEEFRHHRGAITTFVTAPTTQVIVVEQPVYYQTVAAAPSECVTPGYWSYRWIPYTSTQTVWVQGSWAADGVWIDSHWESRPYASGYYEPFWMPGQSYAC